MLATNANDQETIQLPQPIEAASGEATRTDRQHHANARKRGALTPQTNDLENQSWKVCTLKLEEASCTAASNLNSQRYLCKVRPTLTISGFIKRHVCGIGIFNLGRCIIVGSLALACHGRSNGSQVVIRMALASGNSAFSLSALTCQSSWQMAAR